MLIPQYLLCFITYLIYDTQQDANYKDQHGLSSRHNFTLESGTEIKDSNDIKSKSKLTVLQLTPMAPTFLMTSNMDNTDNTNNF
jgi:hypothetical protein